MTLHTCPSEWCRAYIAPRGPLLPRDPYERHRARHWTKQMESSLAAAGPWLAGTQYSLADADFTPYLHRLTMLGLDSLWAGRAAVTGWWEHVRARQSYAAGILDWITPEEGAAFALARARSRPVFERLLAPAWCTS